MHDVEFVNVLYPSDELLEDGAGLILGNSEYKV